jgi:outer membrane biosynthesis protein TonB
LKSRPEGRTIALVRSTSRLTFALVTIAVVGCGSAEQRASTRPVAVTGKALDEKQSDAGGLELDTETLRGRDQKPAEDNEVTQKEAKENVREHGESRPTEDGPHRAVTDHGLDAGAIQAVVHAHANDVEDCYRKLLAKDPGATGSLKLRVAIAAAGGVAEARVVSSTIADDELSSCVVENAKRWQFPKSDRGLAPVMLPYAFAP